MNFWCTNVGDRHPDGRDVQHVLHGHHLGQRRRGAGCQQHHGPDDDGGQAGGDGDAGLLEDVLAEHQDHVDAAELLPGDHRTRYVQRLQVTTVGDQIDHARLLFLRLVHGPL